ncbi:MAG: hypothetical protein AAF707_06605, partial [Pseudomonadota bacterium]
SGQQSQAQALKLEGISSNDPFFDKNVNRFEGISSPPHQVKTRTQKHMRARHLRGPILPLH